MKYFKLNQSALLIFFAVFFTHFFSKVSYVTDSRWTLHTSWALIHNYSPAIDEFSTPIKQQNSYAIDERNGHLYYSFPPGTPILCAPLFYAIEQFAKRVYYTDVKQLLNNYYFQGMELFLAAIFVALATVFLYFVLLQWGLSKWIIWISVIAFAFGTSAWSTASRGLFAHGPSMLFLITGLWAIIKSKQNRAWLFLAGFLFGYSYVIRPTNSISLAVFSVYVLCVYRWQAWRFAVPAAVALLLFVVYTYQVYGQLLSPYYMPSHMGDDGNFFKGLAGNLFSPGRGLFVYSPVFLLLIPLLYIGVRKKHLEGIHYALLAIVALHIGIISTFNKWHGGWCFGPRLFTEVVPFMICLLAIGFKWLEELQSAWVKKLLISSCLILTLISCWINYQGANVPATFEWNYQPTDIDVVRERVWDWNDIQFMR